MRSTLRARKTPGPLPFVLVALLSVAGIVVHAHDPGLSALDVTVTGGRVSARLSMSAPDVELAVSRTGVQAAEAVGRLATESIHFATNGRILRPLVERAWIDGGAGYVQLTFPLPEPTDSPFTISSEIPARLARGHRQLLTVTDGQRIVAEKLLDAHSPPLLIDAATTADRLTAVGLLALGIGHILAGYDHLVFLAGLLLASRSVRELLASLTAFTVAHSTTLAMAALGAVHAPASFVEPLIAVSIAWVGLENLMPKRRTAVTWLVVFTFGLVHGFGFAEALIDVGRWSSGTEVVMTLLSFTAGVEIGQIAVAAVLLPLVLTMRARPAWNARLVPVCSVLIAAAGAYWLVERL
jgi:hydrogenase/urease accessory protein HupE